MLGRHGNLKQAKRKYNQEERIKRKRKREEKKLNIFVSQTQHTNLSEKRKEHSCADKSGNNFFHLRFFLDVLITATGCNNLEAPSEEKFGKELWLC